MTNLQLYLTAKYIKTLIFVTLLNIVAILSNLAYDRYVE